MGEAVTAILKEWGAAGGVLIALGLYLIKREVAFQRQQTRWEDLIEKRHQEVLTLTEKVTAAITKFETNLTACKDVQTKRG